MNLQLLRCLIGKHQRDRRRARADGNTYRSVCTGCGRAMIKGTDGWRLAE